MTDSFIDATDEEFDAELEHFIRLHGVKLIKAPITAGMAAFSVWILSGSILKALAVAAFCVILSAFNTWRRILEPLAFWAFLVSTLAWCEPFLLSKLQTLFRI